MSKTALLIAGLAMSAASAVTTMIGQNQAQANQEKANNAWLVYQKAQRDRFTQMENERRDKAKGLQQTSLDSKSVESRTELIGAETERLTQELGGGQANLDKTASDVLFSGQKWGTEEFQTDLGDRLGQATAAARKRIAALAKYSAYGGSYGGMNTMENINFRDASGGVNALGDERLGLASVLTRYQQVEPEQHPYVPGPLSMILSMGGKAMTAVGGGAFGGVGAPPDPSAFFPATAW